MRRKNPTMIAENNPKEKGLSTALNISNHHHNTGTPRCYLHLDCDSRRHMGTTSKLGRNKGRKKEKKRHNKNHDNKRKSLQLKGSKKKKKDPETCDLNKNLKKAEIHHYHHHNDSKDSV